MSSVKNSVASPGSSLMRARGVAGIFRNRFRRMRRVPVKLHARGSRVRQLLFELRDLFFRFFEPRFDHGSLALSKAVASVDGTEEVS